MYLKSEILKHVREDVYYNILNRFVKCIGIESEHNIKNDDNKRVGRILMIHYSETIEQRKRKKNLLLGSTYIFA